MPISRDKEPTWSELHDVIDALNKRQEEIEKKVSTPAPPNPTPPNPTPAEKPTKPKWLTLQ